MKTSIRKPVEVAANYEAQAVYAKEIGKLFLLLSKQWSKKAKKVLTE